MSLALAFATIFNFVLLTVCGYALIKGGRPERLGAAMNLVAAFVTDLFRIIDPAHLAPADVTIFVIDVCVAAGFVTLGVSTIRFWPIWAGGFAVANLFMSICGALLPRVPLAAYLTGLGIYAYLALGALALGTARSASYNEPAVRNGSRRLWKQHMDGKS